MMKMVMPEIVPHSISSPFMSMIRFESGAGGNHHGHGFTVGMGNPRLIRIEGSDEEDGDGRAAFSRCGDGGDADVDVSSGSACLSITDTDASDAEVVVGPIGISERIAGSGRAIPQVAPRTARRRTLKRKRTPVLVTEPVQLLPERRKDVVQRSQSKAQLEREFWQCYGESVSEWNPSFSADGQQRIRFHWDPDVSAHDVEVMMPPGIDESEPCRSNLRAVLDAVLGNIQNGDPVDLTPLRRLLAACVQKYGRHDLQGKGPPVPGKHPCARGDGKSVHCRYGHPHELRARGSAVPLCLERGSAKGQWFPRFPRNDELCSIYEAHLLLANLGNIHWCPCLNLWAVVEYVTKYAMKAPTGSRQLGDVLRDAIDEVCKYTQEGKGVDYLRKSLQKFYS